MYRCGNIGMGQAIVKINGFISTIVLVYYYDFNLARIAMFIAWDLVAGMEFELTYQKAYE